MNRHTVALLGKIKASLLRPARNLYAWFLWDYMDGHRRARNWILFALGKRHPVFLEYPIRPRPRYGYGKPPHAQLYQIINRERPAYAEYLRRFREFKEHFFSIQVRAPSDSPEPRWVNGTIPGLDAVSLFGLTGIHAPRRYVEVGSGNSTKFVKFAIQRLGLPTRITSIDPMPRAEIDNICDKIFRVPLEDLDLAEFDVLEKGDILFVDNSHYSFMNSDVTVTFLDVLPRLKSGVIVGFHDIDLPNDYSSEVAERHYSEQYLLAVMLLAEGAGWRILFPAAFVSHDPDLKNILSELWSDPRLAGVQPWGGCFWLQKQ